MPRRSRTDDPEELRRKLIELLEQFEERLRTGTLRDQVRELVPAHFHLRDLGSSLGELGDERSARARILRYLRAHQGAVIDGNELMVVSGISEYARRIRELRKEEGWKIYSGVTVSEMRADEETDSEQATLYPKSEEDDQWPEMSPDQYLLMDGERDREAAHRWHTANRVRKLTLSVKHKILQFLRENVGHPVTGEELRYVAGDRTEWARRVRELRTEEGWPVVTKKTGRPDLPVGAYLLESERQMKSHDRRIPDRERKSALRRDDYTCQDCGWNNQLWNPADPRHLELHHIQKHEHGGANTAHNLTTLCNHCHDEAHTRESKANDPPPASSQ